MILKTLHFLKILKNSAIEPYLFVWTYVTGSRTEDKRGVGPNSDGKRRKD